MGDLTLTGIDQAVMALLMERASETGHSPEDLAKDALLRGLMWSPAERLAHADRIRDSARPGHAGKPDVDSTDLIRALRDRT